MLDLFTVIDGFIWFWMQSLHRDVQLMQEFIKTQTNFFFEKLSPPFWFPPWSQGKFILPILGILAMQICSSLVTHYLPPDLYLSTSLRALSKILWQQSSLSISITYLSYTWQEKVVHFDRKRDKLVNLTKVCVFFDKLLMSKLSHLYITNSFCVFKLFYLCEL